MSGTSPIALTSNQGLAISLWCDNHHAMMAPIGTSKNSIAKLTARFPTRHARPRVGFVRGMRISVIPRACAPVLDVLATAAGTPDVRPTGQRVRWPPMRSGYSRAMPRTPAPLPTAGV